MVILLFLGVGSQWCLAIANGFSVSTHVLFQATVY